MLPNFQNMKYDFKNPHHVNQARSYIEKLIHKQEKCELKKITKKTISQNNYFHLLCAYFGSVVGLPMSYVKDEIIKRHLCKDVFEFVVTNVKKDCDVVCYLSFADIPKDKTSVVIDRFINYALIEYNMVLPAPSNLVYSSEILEAEREVENNQGFNY